MAMANTFMKRTFFSVIIFIIITTRGQPYTCTPLDLGDVVFLNNSYLLLPQYGNATIRSTATELTGVACFERSDALKAAILDACRKWEIEEKQYERLGNGSLVMGGEVLEPGTYEFAEGAMWVCEERASGDDQGGERGVISQEAFVKVGSWVSIVALSAHLAAFCLVPALRDLPGYHLAALSVAFLFGYSFSLIGQIKEVLGAECVASGILQQYFFLAAFFCMNVMAVDIYRSLRLAASKLAVKGEADRRRQFAVYMLYAWGAPLLVTATCALMDALRGAPDWLRPRYGSGDVCWMGNDFAKALFFWAPAFALFAANLFLFVGSAFTVYRHSFKGEQGRVTFLLYLRLGVMMGLTWLLGVVAALVKKPGLWFAFDLLNSLQGLFICLLFFCSRRVFKRIVERWEEKVSSNTTSTTPGSPGKHQGSSNETKGSYATEP